MKAIMVLELRGLTQQATALARELDHMGVNADRVRAATIEVVKAARVRAADGGEAPETAGEQGADTYYWTFDTVDGAVTFASRLLGDLWQKANTQGLYYVKPSVAIGWGAQSFTDGHFIDSESIAVYLAADGGRAFTLYLVNAAIEKTSHPFAEPEADARKSDARVRPVDWQKVVAGEAVDDVNVALPSLLLDGDVVYSESVGSAIRVLLKEQAASKVALVFGGPPSFDEELYLNYVRESVKLIREGGCRFAIVSYLPAKDPVTSLIWLEICHRLAVEQPKKLRFSAFVVGEGQLRPFSFQVFDQERVHVGLRSYSPFQETPTLTSAMLLRNSRIAKSFADDFNLTFGSIGPVDDQRYSELIHTLPTVENAERQRVQDTVKELLA